MFRCRNVTAMKFQDKIHWEIILSNYNFQLTKILYQNNFKRIMAFFSHFSRAINVISCMK